MWMKQEHCSAMTRDCQRNPEEKVVRLNQHKKGAPSMCAKSVGSRGSFSTIEGSTACHRRFSRSFEATARASTPWTFLICLWQNSIWKVAKDAAPCSSVFPEKKKKTSIDQSIGVLVGFLGGFFRPNPLQRYQLCCWTRKGSLFWRRIFSTERPSSSMMSTPGFPRNSGSSTLRGTFTSGLWFRNVYDIKIHIWRSTRYYVYWNIPIMVYNP